MNKQSKFVKTAIAAAALGLVAFGAQAATISVTAAKYAAEVFGGTTPAAAITLPNINVVTATAIPAGSTITVQIQLTGGKFATAPTSGIVAGANKAYSPTVDTTIGNIVTTLGTTLAGATAAAAGTGTAAAAANNADVLVVQLFTEHAIGIGGTLVTVQAPQVSAAGLATVGATVSATGSVFIGNVPAPVGAAVPTSGLLESSTAPTAVGTSVRGVTLTSTTGGTTQRVDVGATKPSTIFTTSGASATDTGSTTLVLLGTLGQVETAAAVNAANASYTIAGKAGTDNTKTLVTVTAPAGYFASLGDTGRISVRQNDAVACNGAVLAQSAVFADAAAAAAATSIALPVTALGATTGGATPLPLAVCMSVKGAVPISTGAANVTAVLGATTAQTQDSADTLASTALAALGNNGQTVDVKSFFPAALGEYGYGSFIRIVNTGSVTAPVSVALIDPATGTVGTAAVLATLPSGAATTVTAAQVEAVVGAQARDARPRLRVTAPTSGLQVQSFLQAPNGSISEVSSSN